MPPFGNQAKQLAFTDSPTPRHSDTQMKGGNVMSETALLAFAAALAIGLPALATGWAQSRIGSAGAGALAERPEVSGTVIILLAIPETMVILGFVIAFLILVMLR